MIKTITECTRAEEALKRSEAKFRAISTTATDAIILMDERAKFAYWNPAAEKIFGYKSEEVIGKDLHILIAPKRYHAGYLKGFKKFISTGQGALVGNITEISAIRKDGTEFPIEISMSAFQIDGRWHAVAFIRDITERKRAEEALSESEEKYRLSIDKSHDAIFAIDMDTAQIIDANLKAEELTGYSREELLKLKGWDVHPVEEKEDCQEKMRQVIEGGGVTCEMLFLRKDGSTVPADISSSLIEYGDKRFIQRVCRDITERKKAEEELRQAQQNYEALINSIDGIVWEADARTFQFSFVSKQAKRLLGYPLERWLTEPTFWKDHIHPDDQGWAVAYCARATAEKRPHEFEYRMIAADGRSVWLRDIVTVTVENDRPVKLQGVMVDITERKRAEEEIKELSKFPEKNPNPIFKIRKDGEILYHNPAVFSYIKEPKNLKDLLPKNYKDQISKACHSGKEINVDHIFKERVITYCIWPVSNNEAHIYGRDITERKKAEEDIQKSREFLNRTIESSADAIITTNSEGLVTTWSRGAEDLFGYSVGEVLGKPIHIMYPEEFKEVRRKWQREVSKGNTLKNIETQIYNKNGKLLDINLSLAPLKDKHGGIMGTVGISRDITQFKQAEKELKEKVDELERFTRLAVGRELKMVELKKRIKTLEEKLESGGVS